jgi:hypothetical protein
MPTHSEFFRNEGHNERHPARRVNPYEGDHVRSVYHGSRASETDQKRELSASRRQRERPKLLASEHLFALEDGGTRWRVLESSSTWSHVEVLANGVIVSSPTPAGLCTVENDPELSELVRRAQEQLARRRAEPDADAAQEVEPIRISDDDLALKFSERHGPHVRYVAVWDRLSSAFIRSEQWMPTQSRCGIISP